MNKKKPFPKDTFQNNLLLLSLSALAIVYLMILIRIFSVTNGLEEDIIYTTLRLHGYNTENIKFTKIETSLLKSIYQSSEPLVLENGEMCEQWQVHIYTINYPFDKVYPHPSGSWIKNNHESD